jgi:hypothetical protein
LSPLALADDQLYQLLEEVNKPSWENLELNDTLRSRLGSNYLPFKSSIKQLNKKVNLFSHKLQLDDNFRVSNILFMLSLTEAWQPPWITPTGNIDISARNKFFNDPWVRIKGGFKSKHYKQLLDSIEEDISRISSLTSGAIALEPLRVERKRKANAEYWSQFRQHARRLYDAFSSRWPSQCACQCTHQANLRLDIQKERDIDSFPTFKFIFTFEPPAPGHTIPWTSRAIEIEAIDIANIAVSSNGSLLPNITIHSDTKIHNQWECLQRAPKIDDLCKALRDCPHSDCIGIMSGRLAKHHIHSMHLPSTNTADKRISLQQLLERQGSSFQIKEKCSLALTLSSAVYYLYDTPWLGETWNMNDVSILSQSLLSDQPYLLKTFPSTQPTILQGQRLRIIKNKIIFALGVALLEISYGKPLHTFTIADDLDAGRRTTFTDYLIAERLVESLHTRELPNYATATQRCIHCNFEASVFSLDNNEFRERFYQSVIVPLRKDYNYVMGNVAT